MTILLSACDTKANIPNQKNVLEAKEQQNPPLELAASRLDSYIPLLKNKKVGIVANQGSVIKGQKIGEWVHIVDTLLTLGIDIEAVFSPEHGFRGKADAGEWIDDEKDPKTGITLISLYGSHKKPSANQLKNIDILVFDLQDVGVRFYTYISTLHYVMEAAAEENIPLIVLDRPNPNIQIIDGPVLQPKYTSFVGMHEVPVCYGMSIGEYAQMIHGEKWLTSGNSCALTVITNKNYSHTTSYELPVKPSPNLPNSRAINLYPSLCFFEGTEISCGRGTSFQFQIFGSSLLPKDLYPYTFTPQPNEGAKNPKHQGILCYGLDLTNKKTLTKIHLQWILDAYKNHTDKEHFFNSYFNTLAGNATLQEQIKLGYSMEDIRKTWKEDIDKFKKIREKYLLYP